jgi:hypothetical protein
MKTLPWLSVLASLAALSVRCSSTAATAPTTEECCDVDDYESANCALCPDVTCGTAEGPRCPNYTYGCEGGAMWMRGFDCPEGAAQDDARDDAHGSLLGDGGTVAPDGDGDGDSSAPAEGGDVDAPPE